ncbi:MAG: serine hydrolase domain-containing protein [Phycisphaerae bacterium]
MNQAYGQASLNESLYSLLVVRHGKLVREEYFGGCERGMGGNVKSVSKSFLSALVGIAAENGQFASINDTVAAIMPSLFKNQTDPRKFDIEIQHVVTMTTRLGWNENNLGPWFASDNPHQYVIDQPMSGNPGTAFLYSTGLTHLAGAMLREVTGMEPPDYAAQNLLNPLGIKVQRWDVDRQGDYIGGAEVYITPRDMARFGELYLRGGTLDSNGIVPADWVSWSTSELVPDAWVSGSRSYGAWWWRDTFGDHGAYFAWGYGGQFIFVVPNLDLVVVATSDWTVSQQAAGSQASAIFNLLDDWILPSVLPDPEGIVPAVSEWGAIAMALLLLTSGSLMFRRQFAAA